MPFVAVDPSTVKLDAPASSGFVPVDPAAIKLDHPAGHDMGQLEAGVQGFNSGVPFGEKAAAGIGALGAYGYDKATGLNAGTLSDYYDQARADQKATAKANPGTYLTGALTGIAATLPAASAKAITGEAATTGVRGAINEVPAILSSAGNWVRGGETAADAGKLAKTGALALRMGRSALVAAPVGALYGAGAADPGQMAEGAKSGAKVAAVLGAATPLVAAGWNAVTKPAVTDEVKALASRAQDLGIPLSVDQVAPSNVRDTVQKISQNIPLSGVEPFQEGQRQAWNRALAGTLGQKADAVTPEVLNNYLDQASKDFDNVLSGETIKFGQKNLNAMGDVLQRAKDDLPADMSQIVQNKFDNFIRSSAEGSSMGAGREIGGEKIAALRSGLVNSLKTVPGNVKPFIGDMIDSIDNTIAQQVPDSKIAQLGTIRQQWRNFRTIEPLLEKSTDGTINPTQLMQRVASSPYIKASRTPVGQDDLVDLARIGKQFLPIKGGSDTAQKIAYMKGATELGTGAAAFAAPFKVIPAVAANRAYQSFVNQSPRVVAKILSDNPQLPASAIPQLIEGNAASRLSK